MTEEVESYSKEELFQLFNEYEKQKYRKYYLEIREKKISYNKEKYNSMTEEQKIKYNEYHREYRKNNKDKISKAHKKYYDKMTEEQKTKYKEYQEQKTKYKEYQRLYREKKLSPHPTDAMDALRDRPPWRIKTLGIKL